MYLEATLEHKKEVRRLLKTPSLFDDAPPPGELRVVKVIPNKAATGRIHNSDEYAGASKLRDPSSLLRRTTSQR